MKLLAISDLHLGHQPDRDALARMAPRLDDWLIVAGDVGERPAHLELALAALTRRFAKVFWTPGNHDLWTTPRTEERGQMLYEREVAICRSKGVVTPEDPYVEWPDAPNVVVVPMFLLFDYTFRPVDVSLEGAVAWARETGVFCADERLLDPTPWPSRAAWCHARCAATE